MVRSVTSLLALTLNIVCQFVLIDGTASAQGQGGASVETNAAGGLSDGVLISGHMFFYQDESALGDETLKDGSAVFTRLGLQWNKQAYFSGLGLFYEQDKFGEAQTDQISGMIVELVAGSFFFKIRFPACVMKMVSHSFDRLTIGGTVDRHR